MNKKKLFSGISSAVLILGSLSPMQAFAQTEEMPFTETAEIQSVASGDLGESAAWSLDKNGTLTISGNYTSEMRWPDDWPWKQQKLENKVYVVKFDGGFHLSGSMAGMFGCMENLQSIDFTNFTADPVTNMYSTFFNCKSLKSLDLSKIKTQNVENMQSVFNGCWNLESLDVSGFNTTNAKNMSAMFAYCKSLTHLDLSNFTTSTAEGMQGMFAGCTNLKSINLKGFDTSGVKNMSGMFSDCRSLESLDLSDLRVESVENMTNMFVRCYKLRELDLTPWYFNEKVKLDGMFVLSGLNAVRINQGNSEIAQELKTLSNSWHVEQTGPYDTSAIPEKVRDYANLGYSSVLVERMLKYDLNYESEGNVSDLPSTQSMSSLTGNCEFTVSSTVPKRSGYTFLGWADTPNASQAQYHAGEKLTLYLNSDGQHKDLYAVWRRNSNSGSNSSSNRVNLSSVHEMHRLYNPNSGEHFYTKEIAERDHLVNVGWNYEGTAWYSPKSSSSPVYRLYNPNAGDHHYTLDAKEKDELVKLGWRYEGIGWYSASKSNGQAVHRQYNPNAVAGAHNFTTDEYERDFLINNGWSHEGIAWYGVHPKNIKK